MSEQLRKDLLGELKEGNVVVIVGAGVSIAATNGADVASWVGLLNDGVRYCVDVTGASQAWASLRLTQIDSGDTDELISAADLIEKQLDGRKSGEFARWLRESVGSLQITDNALLKGIGDLGAPIVTISFGATRIFRLRPWKGRGYTDFTVSDGTVFIMPYETNMDFTHEVPHHASSAGRRISVTVRAFEA